MKKREISHIIFDTFNIILMILIMIITTIPFWLTLVQSFNEGTDTMLSGVSLWVNKFTLENYKQLINDETLIKSVWVTIARVTLGVSLGMFIQFTAGYALTVKGYRWKKLITMFFMMPMFFNGGIIANYLLYSELKLLDSFWVYVIPTAFNFYNIIVIRSFISSSIPPSLFESASLIILHYHQIP